MIIAITFTTVKREHSSAPTNWEELEGITCNTFFLHGHPNMATPVKKILSLVKKKTYIIRQNHAEGEI